MLSNASASWSPPKSRIVIGVILVSLMMYPAVLVVIGTAAGPGASPDSASYVAAADNLARYGQLFSWEGHPISRFPPGYPVLLAAFGVLGVTSGEAAVLLNAVSAAALVLLTYLVGYLALGSRRSGIACATLVSCSAAVPQAFTWIWSEPAFCVLVMCALWALGKAVGTSGNWTWLLVAAGFVATATLFRFAGVFLIPVVSFAALLSDTITITRQRAIRALVAGLLACTGLALATARNAINGFAPLGERYPGGRSVVDIIEQSLTVTGTYINPFSDGGTAIGIGLAQMVLVLLGSAIVLRTHAKLAMVIFAAVTAYWLLLVWSEVTTPIDRVSVRLTVPIFAPAVIGTVFSLQWIARGIARVFSSKAGSRVGMAIVIATTAACLALNMAAGTKFAATIGSQSQGYNRSEFAASPLATAVDDDVCQAGVASSNPWLAYWVSDCIGIVPIPPRSRGAASMAERAVLTSGLRAGTIRYLAFFKDRPSLGPADIRKLGIRVERVAKFRDGELYRVIDR